MISTQDLELRVGARLLLSDVSLRVGPGDRVGLVGRNGAGKTTLTKVLAGEAQPTAGTVTRSGTVGYLPQDPRTGDLSVIARDRILSARGLDETVQRLRAAEEAMANVDDSEVGVGGRSSVRTRSSDLMPELSSTSTTISAAATVSVARCLIASLSMARLSTAATTR